jgi:hypothetical protein
MRGAEQGSAPQVRDDDTNIVSWELQVLLRIDGAVDTFSEQELRALVAAGDPPALYAADHAGSDR